MTRARKSQLKKLFRKRRVIVTVLLVGSALLSTAILFMSGRGDVTLAQDLLLSGKRPSVPNIDRALLDLDVIRERLNTMQLNSSLVTVKPSSDLPLDLSRTWNETRIIYNRVDKSGSRSLLYTFRRLRVENGFIHNQSRIYLKPNLTLSEQRDLVAEVQSLRPPFIFDRHLHYVDFNIFGARAPSWINLIREPLPRLISRYYFKRYGDEFQQGPRMGFNGTEEDINQSFDDCVLLDKHECSEEGGFLVVPYFCGQEPACQKPSRWALEKAKQNVVEKFAFVGILEDFNSTLIVLEKMFPQFFKGLYRTYKHVKYKVFRYRSSTKTETSSVAMAIMRSRLGLEYEFYEFVRDRLEIIKKQLNISFTEPNQKKKGPRSK
ncbi:uronyl 2-sulfotransferase-like [Ptychodera flava]|uniref:uronyl 2-sulfotransferase-like n=1 Tax=Ptychodera flava TaxID=63121 RepID=UPI00396A87BE